MVGHDRVRGAVDEGGQAGGRIGRAPQRRVDPAGRRVGVGDQRAVGPRVARDARLVQGLPGPAPRTGDPLVREAKMVGCHVAGHGQPGRLGPAHGGQRPGGREMGEMQPGTRCVGAHGVEDGDGALGRGDLARRRPPLQAEDRRDDAFARLGTRRERGVLDVLDDRESQHARVQERVAEQGRALHRRTVVGEPDDAGVGELTEGRESLPGPSDGHSAMGQQLHRRAGGGGGPGDPGEDARLVRGRGRVRHRADGREAAMRGRREPAGDRLRILVAGLAEMDVEVEQAGHHQRPRPARCRRRRRLPARSRPPASRRRTTISPGPSRRLTGSTSQARLISRSGTTSPTRSSCIGHGLRVSAGEKVEESHSDRHPVRHLLGDHASIEGRHVRRDLDALVHRARVHYEG